MAERSRLIRTILLTGFLGSGKTTLLNRLIQYYHRQKTVVLVNEFGQVSIDGQLLVAGNYQKIELNKGSLLCICVRTDFISEIEKIAHHLKPELLLIEATGLADTSELEGMLQLPKIRNAIDLQACICLVDCLNFLKIKDILRVPAAQIRSADLVLLNKIDLIGEDQLQQITTAIREISPGVPVVPTQFAEFQLSQLDQIRRPAPLTADEIGDGRPDPVTSITLTADGSFSQQSWHEFLALVQPYALRLKGFILVDQTPYQVDATMDQLKLMAMDSRPAEV
ncbi:MAG: GTP-binding protein, partial [candidate division KSB1 bacterium]|nr:GTP-binding protein [candidate division KSB1 bacterium]